MCENWAFPWEATTVCRDIFEFLTNEQLANLSKENWLFLDSIWDVILSTFQSLLQYSFKKLDKQACLHWWLSHSFKKKLITILCISFCIVVVWIKSQNSYLRFQVCLWSLLTKVWLSWGKNSDSREFSLRAAKLAAKSRQVCCRRSFFFVVQKANCPLMKCSSGKKDARRRRRRNSIPATSAAIAFS